MAVILQKQQNYCFKNVNIEFNYGDSIGVIGKNGSGKSTLLKIIEIFYLQMRFTILLMGPM